MKEIIAHPAELVFAQGDEIITSLALGSSIGICLYDPTQQCGGFIQAILPYATSAADDLKYVDHAIQHLYHHLLQYGSKKENLQAKLVGGARMFQFPDFITNEIGKENIKAARSALDQLQIPIIAEDVGDVYGRTIHYHLEDGLVYIETKNQHLYYI